MQKDKEIAEQLKTLYENKLYTFPVSIQRHYSERLYRITGDKKYTRPIELYFLSKFNKLKRFVSGIDDLEQQKAMGLKLIEESTQKNRKARIIKRAEVYRTLPEFKYYQEVVWFFNKLNEHQILNILVNNADDILQKLNKINFKNYLSNEKLITLDPVQTANTVFHLRNLGLQNHVDSFIGAVNKIFNNPLSIEEYMNKLYSYTHILISETNYYQKFLDNKYQWIYDFFDSEINNIIKLDSDIIAEIGVCYRMAKLNNAQLDKIKSHLTKEISNHGLLIRNGDLDEIKKIENLEHRNVLAIMLFSEYNKLFPGPNLETIQQELT